MVPLERSRVPNGAGGDDVARGVVMTPEETRMRVYDAILSSLFDGGQRVDEGTPLVASRLTSAVMRALEPGAGWRPRCEPEAPWQRDIDTRWEPTS